MNWTTLYITGKSDFSDDVLKKLESGEIDFMPGYLETSSGRGYFDMYWISESTDIKEIKRAIGSKLIWKYRLRLHTSLEEFTNSMERNPRKLDFTKEEQLLMDSMRRSA